jgi:hypothetical protein
MEEFRDVGLRRARIALEREEDEELREGDIALVRKAGFEPLLHEEIRLVQGVHEALRPVQVIRTRRNHEGILAN